jgi:phage terminase small subunit
MVEGLSLRQRDFALAYATHRNATRAAKEAGYSGDDNGLAVAGHRVLRNVKVRQFINELTETRALPKYAVLAELAALATADPSIFYDEHGKVSWAMVKKYGQVIQSITHYRGEKVEIKLHDKIKALELLGKNLQLFADRVEHTGVDGGPIETKITEVVVTHGSESMED